MALTIEVCLEKLVFTNKSVQEVEVDPDLPSFCWIHVGLNLKSLTVLFNQTVFTVYKKFLAK